MLAYVVAMDLSNDERSVFYSAALGRERVLPTAAEGRGRLQGGCRLGVDGDIYLPTVEQARELIEGVMK